MSAVKVKLAHKNIFWHFFILSPRTCIQSGISLHPPPLGYSYGPTVFVLISKLLLAAFRVDATPCPYTLPRVSPRCVFLGKNCRRIYRSPNIILKTQKPQRDPHTHSAPPFHILLFFWSFVRKRHVNVQVACNVWSKNTRHDCPGAMQGVDARKKNPHKQG